MQARNTAVWLLLSCIATAQPTVVPDRAPLPLAQPVRDKNFFALTILAESAEIRRLGIDKKDETAKWSETDRKSIEEDLRNLYRQSAGVRALVDGKLRRSGVMQLHAAKSGEDLLAATWQEAAAGMNRLIDVYSEGVAPRYPAIDSPLSDVKSANYARLKKIAAAVSKEEALADEAFFAPTLRYAISLLEINLRDEAGRYEPMDKRENLAAFERVQKIRWADFPYSAIVVPGSGSDRPGIAISPFGRLRARIAAARYHARKAPFVIVSGGHVHPNQTPFCEAIEMKRVLMTEFGVPENAILIDPHARHTTTNIRNAARLIYRYGLPFDKTALITTDDGQSAYIEAPLFAKRCETELRYLPYRRLKRTSPFDLEFAPTLESLFEDPTDALDP
jgi:hypothetical protein